MRSHARCFDELRAYCESVPLIDCHDHSGVCGPRYEDPIQVVVSGYFPSDLESMAGAANMAIIQDRDLPLEKRWEALEPVWRRTRFTGYGQVTQRVLREFYGESELTLDALRRMKDQLLDLSDPQTFEALLEKANIAVRLVDARPPNRRGVIDGTVELTPRARLVIPLPPLHAIRDYASVEWVAAPLGRTVTTLDEYLDVCRELFEAYRRVGAVAFKDQSAYARTLAYGNPTRAEAEAVFNRFMEDPRRSAAYPDGVQPLDDYLFHAFLRMARDMDLPVQIHTGHMAGVRNDIVKTNAAGLTRVLELHRDVRFDLFHANWPYSGELIYLAKNYPNVHMDFCWANIIDPVYCQRLFQQALSAVPHGKVHGYGSDYHGSVDRAWAHAQIARDNVAIALSELVEMEYLDLDGAREVARAWLLDNANAFFRLGLD